MKPGDRLGPYEVIGLLGAGGMGEVYKARDTRLDRTVAIKILPPDVGADPDRRARFEREAKAIAALNHPHICTLHDIGCASPAPGPPVHFLVMEHLVGETLAQRLRKGPLPLEQTLTIGAQMATALAAAHREGVIHRDLKPGNVMLTKSGAKLLDFGLAKLKGHGEQPAAAHLSSAATRSEPLTGEGAILGTPQYMAPEQLQGKPADARTDLWALGAILYETVTGKRAFEGANQASVITAIMSAQPPPIQTLQPMTPPLLERLVTRCLMKEPDERCDSAHELADELRWIAQAPQAAGPAMTNRRARYRWSILGLSVLAAGILVGVAAARLVRGRAGRNANTERHPVVRGVIELPADMPLALRADTYIGYHPTLIAVAPDGARVAFVGPAHGGSTQLYMRDLNALEVRPIPDTEGALHPFFSPDGRWLGFLTVDKVKKVPIAGGPSEALCNARSPMRAGWTRDGWIYVGENEGTELSRVSEAGGQLSKVIDSRVGLGQILPDGRAALVMTGSNWSITGDYSHIEVLSLDTLKSEPLSVTGYDARVTSSGHLLFVRSGNLMVAQFDIGRRKVLGEPMVAVAGVSTNSMFSWAQYAVSENGLLVYVPGADRAIGEIVAVDRAGGVQRLHAPERLYGALDLDWDGTRLAVQVGDVNDYALIFDLVRQEGRKLPAEKSNFPPIWTPDGKSVAVRAGGPTTRGLYRVPVTGDGAAELIREQGVPDAWSPDGRWLAFELSRGEPHQGVIQVQGDHKVIPLPPGVQFCFSPDSRFLVYVSYDTGAAEIWVRSFPDPSFVRQVSVDGGFEPRWVRDHIFYRKGRRWFSARVTSLQPNVEWEPPQLAFETDFLDTPGMSYAVSPDGQRLFVVKSTHEPTVSKLVFVQNWFEDLKAMVAVRP